MKTPEIIFLQWHGDCHPEDCSNDDDVDPSGASWCWEQIFPADIEYVRMDKFNAVIRQRDELLAALKDARDSIAGWGEYAPMYFQEKHGLVKELYDLDEFIAKAED